MMTFSSINNAYEVKIDILNSLSKVRHKYIIKRPHFSIAEINIHKKNARRIINIGKSLDFSQDTICKAMNYISRILNECILVKKEVKNIAMICILIAAKLNEPAEKLNKLLKIISKSLMKANLSALEWQIMTILHWNLQCITIADFLDLFMDEFESSFSNYKEKERSFVKFKEVLRILSDLCLEKYEFISDRKSVV